MPGRRHQYATTLTWTGNRGTGTADYRAYDRSYVTASPGRPSLDGSADPPFRGDGQRWNPELLLVAALSQCHLLSYLHLCAVNDVVVVEYSDQAAASMAEDGDGGGRFVEATLRPRVTVAHSRMVRRAMELHDQAAQHCFIASSVSFPVRHEPVIRSEADAQAAV